MQKGIAPIVLLLAVLVIGGLVAGGFYLERQSKQPIVTPQEQQTITQLQSLTPTLQPTIFSYPALAISPTPITTAVSLTDWELYTNSRLNFSFKYPSSFRITIEKGLNEGANNPELMTIDLTLSNSEVWFNLIDSAGYHGGVPSKSEEIIVGGERAKKFSYAYLESNKVGQIDIHFSHGNKDYTIVYGSERRQQLTEKELELLDQILSTFKFTD